LGITKDYTYGDPFDGYVKANPAKLQVASGDGTLEKNAKMLELGRIGAFIDDTNVVGLAVQEGRIANFRQAGCLEATETYIAFSPANPKAKEYAKALADGVATLRQNGKLKEIIGKYGVSDW
jgi:polar amino acid transport system substrate-binding protein